MGKAEGIYRVKDTGLLNGRMLLRERKVGDADDLILRYDAPRGGRMMCIASAQFRAQGSCRVMQAMETIAFAEPPHAPMFSPAQRKVGVSPALS